MSQVDNLEDVIDSRDIVARVEAIKEDLLLDGDDESLSQELELLEQLLSAIRHYGGDSPEDGVTLVRDSHFEDYAQGLAEDLGYMSGDNAHSWPFTCIDWEQAARELRMDYTSIDFDGVDYWVR